MKSIRRPAVNIQSDSTLINLLNAHTDYEIKNVQYGYEDMLSNKFTVPMLPLILVVLLLQMVVSCDYEFSRM